MSQTPTIDTRTELLSLLSEACELEHGLACSYLYSAFTLKQDLVEGGLTWEQLQKVRLWAAQIYFVASEEMLHLAQAWNLLAAIGGTPYYMRPNFPQGTKYYSINAPLELEPFGRRALQRFKYYEHPMEVSSERSFFKELGVEKGEAAGPGFRTVGELYHLIASGFRAIPEKELFIGDPRRQVGEVLADFPDIIAVHDRESALRAIGQITEQGEGTLKDRADCHFGMFLEILRQYEDELRASGGAFVPARDTIENPVARLRGDYGVPVGRGREEHSPLRGNLIEDEYSKRVASLFDSAYVLMLRMLSYVFSNSMADPALLRAFSQTAIRMMPVVIKPLGEALTLLPAGEKYGSKKAGPAFGMTRHVPFSPDPEDARTLAQEGLAELTLEASEIAARPGAPPQLQRAAESLKELGSVVGAVPVSA
jgi:hypothetical protein